MRTFRRYRRLIIGAMVALALVVIVPGIAHAQDPVQPWNPGWYFDNCITIWWWTECYHVYVQDPTNSADFQALYAFCQFIGLCP